MIKEILVEIKVLLGLGKWYKVFNSISDAITNIPQEKSILVQLGKTEICLARYENIITAFINVCPHHQMPLNRGSFNENKEWICPYHRHCFNIKSGKNITMPSTHKLELYYVKTSLKGVFIYNPNKK